MTRNTTLIIITGGGTAGHVFPAFPVVDRLRDDGVEVAWMGSVRGMEKKLVEEANITYYGIPSGKLRRYFSLKNVTDLLRISFGFIKAFFLLLRLKPAVLLSKGGFVTVPPVAAARILGIPTLTHESDVDPGLATRLNLKLGARALLSYEETRPYLKGNSAKNAVVTGNPIRAAITEGNREKGRLIAGLNPEDLRPLILVLGGSQGAREVNSLVTDSLEALLEKAAIVHQTGAGNPAVEDRPGYMSRPFFAEELPHLLAAADLAVARSGAGSVWELAATGTPALFIPLRGATRGDQLLNAAIAEKAGMSLTLEKDASADSFLGLVTSLLDNPQRCEAMTVAASAFPAGDSALRIHAVLKEYLK